MSTVRLDQKDSFAWSFESEVVECASAATEARGRLILEESAFYPESGGQMADHGVIRHGDAELRVVDVQIDDAGRVEHIIEGELPPVGAKVTGEIDPERRREHMSLHTAQHMLSRALVDIAGAETVSSRLGESGATIDTSIVVSHEQAREVESRVQAVIDADAEVRVLYPSAGELATMSLRRMPKVSEGIRIVEVDGFDMTPCGGTHCTRTGQIGLAHVLEIQSHKSGSRVTFVAGSRARRVLYAESNALRALAKRFTCGPHDVEVSVDKLERQIRETREALGVARAGWARALTAELAGSSPVVHTFDGLDRDTLRSIATQLTKEGDVVVALAARGRDATDVIVARGPESEFVCGMFLRDVAKALGGGGGGRPERAEGRIPVDADWEDLVRARLAG